MTAVIIASASRDLVTLAMASVRRFAPKAIVYPIDNGSGVGHKNPRAIGDAVDHASAIEFARSWLPHFHEHVVLLDDDAMVTSEQWLPTLQRYHDEGYGIVGGKRHRGLEAQSLVDGVLVPHASMLSMTRESFDGASTFHMKPVPGEAFVKYDTGVLACLELVKRGVQIRVLPYELVDEIAWYETYTRPLWAHLARGTSFSRGNVIRESLRSVTALWSPRSRKIRRRQALRSAYIKRGHELLASCGR